MILSLFYTSKFLFSSIFFYSDEQKRAINLRIYLENMGPVFIKIGQLISTHPEWLNNFQYKELSLLRNNISVKNDISKYINKNSNLKINKEEISNGSIATVHLGEYKEKKVVIKIKRNNIENDLINTMLFFKPFAYISQYIPFICKWKLYSKFKFINNIINKQIDFNNEINNLIKFKSYYGNMIKIPTVYKEISDNNMIVMEYLPGLSTEQILKDINKKEKEEMVKKFFGFLVTSINLRGLFHADLHPGNFAWIRQDNTIDFVLYDFGMIGSLSSDKLKILNQFYVSLIQKNLDLSVSSIQKLIINSKECNNMVDLELDLKNILKSKFELNDLKIFSWIEDIFILLKKYNLELNDEFTDFEFATISLDGIITQLSDNKNYFDFLKEILI